MTWSTSQYRICVVGSGTRFLSGISYYTMRLTNALAQSHRVSAILMRQLLPTFAYPGRERVGVRLTELDYAPRVRVFDGVDWFWLPSMFCAILSLLRESPDLVIFQWWTATVIHSYVALALVARLMGKRVVIEFHEVLDPGELKLAAVRAYVGWLGPLLIQLADAFVVHSDHDRQALERQYRIQTRPIAKIIHGPYDQYVATAPVENRPVSASRVCNLLYFGVIRPYKGLEDLIRAFDEIPRERIHQFRLTIVGETWERWTLPAELIARSRYRERITFINRYVTDSEVAAAFAATDAVVLPYLRSSASGPLHIAMSHGLPVVITRVGGLLEAVDGYQGALLVPPRDRVALSAALLQVRELRGKRFVDPHSWANTVARYTMLLETLQGSRKVAETVA